MKVLLDNCLAPEIARGINHLLIPEGHKIEAKKDKFGTGRIDDVDWIAALDDEGGWAFVTLDTHIRRRPHEREVLRASKVTGFFMSPAWQHFTPIEQAGRLMGWWPKLEEAYRGHKAGTCFPLPWRISGSLHRLKP